MPLAAADASGRIQQVGRLPIDQLAPGTYELRAIVRQGTEQVSRIDDAEDRGVAAAVSYRDARQRPES